MIKILLFLLLLLSALPGSINPQSKRITERFFPDPDVDIPTPAFSKQKGYTTYDEMMAYLRGLEAEHDSLITLSFVGNSQRGVPVPAVRITNGNDPEKLRVFMQGALHGDEPGSAEGLLYLMHRLVTEDSLTDLLHQLDILIIPVANVDGYAKDNRYAANGLDLNRDQTKLQIPESLFLKRVFAEFNPAVAVDFHEYRPYRRDYAQLGDFGVTGRYDVMFLYSGNLNVPAPLRQFTQQHFVEDAKKSMDGWGYTHHDYFTSDKEMGRIVLTQGSSNARSSATGYALHNCISSLIEVRGVGIERTSFARRTHITAEVATSYLRTAAAHKASIISLLDSTSSDHKPAVVTARRPTEDRDMVFIDLDTEQEVTIVMPVKDAWLSEPRLTRSRPEGYFLMTDNQQLAEFLNVMGIQFSALTEPATAKVERYLVTEYEQESLKYEGVQLQSVSTALDTLSLTVPAGALYIPMQQSRSNLIIELLEPEAPNSWVHFDLIHTALNDTLPIYRSLTKP